MSPSNGTEQSTIFEVMNRIHFFHVQSSKAAPIVRHAGSLQGPILDYAEHLSDRLTLNRGRMAA